MTKTEHTRHSHPSPPSPHRLAGQPAGRAQEAHWVGFSGSMTRAGGSAARFCARTFTEIWPLDVALRTC